ncbi:MAG: histidine--tRNA ligase [Lachnospiraceae bacterium]|nr:histidine--tRNA ligase [Lachnospiraceae bacterium]
MKFIKTPVKGMCDMLPSDMRLREHVLSMIKKTYSAYGFMQIETPVMEHIENLSSNQGGENEKLIFKVMKRGAELSRAIEAGKGEYADNGLRYDLTLPLSRFYANNKEQLPMPFKALQIGNVWRADNPQKGRFRQFTQCDIDILGDETDLAEIELISATSRMLSDIFAQIGISEFTVHVGDRRILKAAAVAAGFKEEDLGQVLISLDKLDKIGVDGILAELKENGFDEEVAVKYLSMYEKNDNSVESFCEGIPSELLPETVKQEMNEIIEGASAMLPAGVSIMFDPCLVRGMGYYTGPIFEVTIDGYGFAIAGGGRYDEMIGKFAGMPVPACGFSIGFERIVTILKDNLDKLNIEKTNGTAFLIDKKVSAAERLKVFEKAAAIRAAGGCATILPMKKNVKRQVELLENEGYTEFEKVYGD